MPKDGVPVGPDGVAVLPKDALAAHKGDATAIARTEEYFTYPSSPGVMFLDYDPRIDGEAIGMEDLISRLASAALMTSSYAMCWTPSSSSHVCDVETGEDLTGLRGQRVYLAVQDASDIPRAGAVLHKRCWLAGHGYVLVSGSGSLLERGLFDNAVYQASRLDYASGAVTGEGLEQRRGAPELCRGVLDADPGVPIDTRKAFPDLTADEETAYQALVERARAAQKETAEETRAAWIEDRLRSEVFDATRAIFEAEHPDYREWGQAQIEPVIAPLWRREEERQEQTGRRRVWERVADGSGCVVLPVTARVWFAQDKHTTVGALLRSADAMGDVKEACCDPREPDYRHWHRAARVNPGDRWLMSHAHGVDTEYVLATDAEFAAIFEERALNLKARRGEILQAAETGSVLDVEPLWLAAALSAEGGDAAVSDLHALAVRQGNVRLWRRGYLRILKLRYRERQKTGATVVEETVRQESQPTKRVAFDVGDPNSYKDIAQKIECLARDRGLAFSYGGVFITVKDTPSAHMVEYDRDEHGKRIEESRRHARVLATAAINANSAYNLASKVATFHRIAEDPETGEIRERPVCPPSGLLQILRDEGGSLSPLVGIAAHPVWYDDGMLAGANVYHVESKLLLHTGEFDVEEWSAPRAAYTFLTQDWLGDFPFASEKDRATAVMLMLTILAAKTTLINQAGPPHFMISAPSAQTGKSFLVDIIHRAVTGRTVPSATLSQEREELAKVITSMVMEGASVAFFDNVQTSNQVGNAYTPLIKLVTDTEWQGRILGKNENYRGPAAITPITTGNNIVAAGDMASRTVEIRLVPDPDVNLAKRDFRHSDLAAWTFENRSRLLGAAAAILRVKSNRKPEGRFPMWARTVALPVLEVAGCAESFFGVWEDIAEADAQGKTTKGAVRLIAAIAALRTADGSEQPMQGVWWQTSTLLERIGAGVWRDANFGEDVSSPQAAVSVLRRNADVSTDGFQAARRAPANLGQGR